jgi:protein-S-isoprenylcysteine O-methyltransferase Ste14
MKIAFFIYAAFCLIGLGIRTAYEIFKKNGKLDPKNPVIFAFVFAGMILMLASWAFMGPADPFRVDYPAAVRYIGLALMIVGIGLALAGLIKLKGLENIDHLVTTGLYAKLRHPMYTGFICWIAGWIIYKGAVISFFIGLIGIGNILYWRRLEERKLTADYGEAYREYRKRSWF